MRTHLHREPKKSTKKRPPNERFRFRCGLYQSDFCWHRPLGQVLPTGAFDFLTAQEAMQWTFRSLHSLARGISKLLPVRSLRLGTKTILCSRTYWTKQGKTCIFVGGVLFYGKALPYMYMWA